MVESEDLADVYATLENLGAAGSPGVFERDGMLVTLVGRRAPVTEAFLAREIGRETEAVRVYAVVYKPLTDEQAPQYPSDAVYWVIAIPRREDLRWSLREMGLD